jgi:hypothetical protein
MAGGTEGPAAPYRVEWRDGLAFVRLSCGKANALNPRSLGAIERALDEATDGGARGLILAGYDRFFSAGLDLVALYGIERDAMDGFMAWFDAVMLRVFTFPRPVVAAVGGHAVAGGAVLALACDARVTGAAAGRVRPQRDPARRAVPGLRPRDRPPRRPGGIGRGGPVPRRAVRPAGGARAGPGDGGRGR